MLKKLIFPILLMLLFTGCNEKEFDWVMKIDGREIVPGEYVAAQMSAYSQAQMLEENIDMPDSTIEGMPVSQWIEKTTTDILKYNVYIEEEFEKRNLKLTNEMDDFIKKLAEQDWENVSDIYKNNNLDIEYYLKHLQSLYKEQLVFNDIFLYGENETVSEDEIWEYLNENLCRISLFRLSREDFDAIGNEQFHTDLKAVVDSAVQQVNDGLSITQAAYDSHLAVAALLDKDAVYTDGKDLVSTAIVSKSSMALIYDFLNEMFDAPVGSCSSYEIGNEFYVRQKKQLCETQVEYYYLKQDVVALLRDKEFEEMSAQACENLIVEINEEALAYYTPSKIRMIIE